jgi:hypothetical protein
MSILQLWEEELECAGLAVRFFGYDEVEDGAKVVGRDYGTGDCAEVGVRCCSSVSLASSRVRPRQSYHSAKWGAAEWDLALLLCFNDCQLCAEPPK